MKTHKSLLVLIMLISVACVSFLLSPSALLGQDKKMPEPAPPSGDVTLPLSEYNHLVDLANKSRKRQEVPPLPYALKRADLKLRVTGGAVLGSLVIDGEVFNKAATKVPLTTGMTILNAKQEGKALPLQQEGATSMAVLPGAADFSVALDTGMPLGIEAGRASFSLPVPAAGSVRLSLVIPGEHTNVHISPGLITNRTSDSGQTTVEATLSPGQPASIWWATRESAAPVAPREVRFLSDVKTLVSVSEGELRIAALADITVVQGDPLQFVVQVPAGYEITGASGATVESIEMPSGTLVLKLNSGTPRSHQFLIAMEKPLDATKVDAPFLSFKDAQRETGEVLIEGAGTMEMTATEGGGLKRMDLKEINPYLRSLSRFPLQAAFRYHRQPSETPSLALSWVRFPDSGVLAAVAERAVITTLVTTEGRSLTEVKLIVKNQAQPFLKVDLPAGANILSAEVAGEKVKPVQAPDGSRVPMLRPGFRPSDSYEVSFVFMHSGAPFAKKGGSELSLPGMDVPISLLEWEVFLPEQYKVKDFGGDAIAANLVPPVLWATQVTNTFSGTPTSTVASTENGGQANFSLMVPGVVGITTKSGTNVSHDSAAPVPEQPQMGQTALGNSNGATGYSYNGLRGRNDDQNARDAKKTQEYQLNAASSNVFDLQKKVAGVLPVRVDVPRAGNSYRFARALVLDEETKVSFNYKTK